MMTNPTTWQNVFKKTPDVNVKTKVTRNISHDKFTSNMTLSEETDFTKLRKR
jgi:hypothetical protein